MAIMNSKSSASKENRIPKPTEKHPFTKPLQVRKIPPQPDRPGAPLTEPSMFTLVQPGGGRFQETGIIDGPFEGLPFKSQIM